MRIRPGFVSNSSSTSFLILTKEELTESAFIDLMGAAPDSPLSPIFRELYDRLMMSSTVVDYATAYGPPPSDFRMARLLLSDELRERLADAQRQKLRVYYGSLGSDGDRVESFFCTESFVAENEKIYFNCVECGW